MPNVSRSESVRFNILTTTEDCNGIQARRCHSSTELFREPSFRRKSSMAAIKHNLVAVKRRSSHFANFTLHGAMDIANAQSPGLKLFWLVVIVVATGLGVWMCALIINHLAGNPTVSKFNYMSPVVRYPYLTVCSSSVSPMTYFLMQHKLERDNVSDNAVKRMLLSGPIWFIAENDVPNYEEMADESALAFMRKMEEEFGPSPAAQFHGFFMKYGASCPEIFHSCRNANWQKMNCCDIFKPVFNFQHGLCYANDPERMPVVQAPGLFSNFYIKFKRPQLWLNPSKMELAYRAPAIDIVIDTGIDQGIWRADNLVLDYTFWALIRLNIKNVVKASWAQKCHTSERLCFFRHFTFSNCMWERTLLRNPKFNTPGNCLFPMEHLTHLGLDINSEENKNQLTQMLPEIRANQKFESREEAAFRRGCRRCLQRHYCTIDEIRSFVYNFSDGRPGYSKNSSFQGITHWISKFNISGSNPCQEPCNHWEYTYAVSKDFEPELSVEHSGLTLTFPEAEYARVEEVATLQWYDYVALIGGVWGLWVGASIITGIQFVVYVVRMFLKPKDNNNNNKSSKAEDAAAKQGRRKFSFSRLNQRSKLDEDKQVTEDKLDPIANGISSSTRSLLGRESPIWSMKTNNIFLDQPEIYLENPIPLRTTPSESGGTKTYDATPSTSSISASVPNSNLYYNQYPEKDYRYAVDKEYFQSYL